MWALASNVWSFLHRFALGTAILPGGYIAGTDRVGAFLALIRCHVVSPFIGSAEGLDVRRSGKGCSKDEHSKRTFLENNPETDATREQARLESLALSAKNDGCKYRNKNCQGHRWALQWPSMVIDLGTSSMR